jgi:hypothetical protein
LDLLCFKICTSTHYTNISKGDLTKEDELLSWLVHQKRHSEIPEVTDEIVEKLIETEEYLAVVFCEEIFILFISKNTS